MENITGESSEEKVTRLEKENLEFKAENAALREANRQTLYDYLTGLKTRRALDEEMNIYFNRIYAENYAPERRHEATEDKENLVLAIFDIDKFKKVNDTFGHQMGDAVLKMVAKIINSCVRDSDIVARWGGEEIVIVFPGTSLEGAKSKANLIRQKISEIKFENNPELKVTISAGLAHSSDFENKEDLFKAADKALYESKNSGRNKVTAHSEIQV